MGELSDEWSNQGSERFRGFLEDAQEAARRRYAVYQQLAGITVPRPETTIDDGGFAATPERQV